MTEVPSLAVSLGPLRLRNPVMPASGCFGPELAMLIDVGRLGAVVTKTIFVRPRAGNPGPRVAETAAGMLNSIGIPSRGVSTFVRELLPAYLRCGPPVIVSVGGLTVREYWELAEALADVEGIAAVEVNVSCPNLEAGGLEIGTDPHQVEAVVRGVTQRLRVPVFVKLTPNVTSIGDLARAAEAGGATALTAINTVLGMAIDVESRRPKLGATFGGLSGPAIKPIAVRCVFEVSRAVSIPVIGAGGITRTEDALEFLIAGASAVQVGTANFSRPDAMLRIIEGIGQWLANRNIGDVKDIIGTVKVDRKWNENSLFVT